MQTSAGGRILEGSQAGQLNEPLEEKAKTVLLVHPNPEARMGPDPAPRALPNCV